MDPGIRGCGCAWFNDAGRLAAAEYVPNPARRGNRAHEARAMAEAVRAMTNGGLKELAVEWMVVYFERIQSGEEHRDPNDLLALCGVDSALAALFPDAKVSSYTVSEWKGQLTKEACHHRAHARLDAAERLVWDEAVRAGGTRAHNTLDAVGIGLHHLGRLERRRVIPT